MYGPLGLCEVSSRCVQGMCVCQCVTEREREREREREAATRQKVFTSGYMCVCQCVTEREREREREAATRQKVFSLLVDICVLWWVALG